VGGLTLSRHPITVLSTNLLGDETDNHARYLEVDIQGLRIINIYLPNGNPIGTDRFAYKLAWMDRLKRRLAALNKKKISTVDAMEMRVAATTLSAATVRSSHPGVGRALLLDQDESERSELTGRTFSEIRDLPSELLVP
jgi:exonuclease III